MAYEPRGRKIHASKKIRPDNHGHESREIRDGDI